MKDIKEIEQDALKLEIPPKHYNLLEIHCFLALKQLLVMYWNKQISSENATKIKMLIYADYEKRNKQYDFQQSMFQRHIEDIKKTETARIKLIKKLKEENEATEEDIAECLNLALEIVSIVFRGEF